MPISKLMESPQAKTALTGALSGAAGGAITTALLNKKSARNLLKAGGLVAVGGIAMKAWQSYQSNNEQAVPQAASQSAATQALHAPSPEATPELAVATHHEALLILQSMIAAAHADGILDEQEQQMVWNKAVSSGLPPEDLGAVGEALKHPSSPETLAAAATTLETKIEVYTAAACVIDGECEAGNAHLTKLGQLLDLPAGLTSALKLSAASAQ